MNKISSIEQLTKVGRGSPLNINWELVSHCQFKCTYCYYKPIESQTDYAPLSKLIIKKISMITDQAKVTLLGGEPTLHPLFHNIVESLHGFSHISSIPIVTNFEKPLEFWLKLLPFKDKVKIVISFHLEYPQKDILEKINILQKDFLLDLVFVVHNEIKFLPKMIELADKIYGVCGEDVSINFVRIHEKIEGNEDYCQYPEAIEVFMAEQNRKLVLRKNTEYVNAFMDNKWEIVPKFDFINRGLNRFHGWSCKLRAFIIHENGMVSSSCSKIKKHILLQDFKENVLTCAYKICECDDYWEFPKIKNENGII